MPWQKTMKVRFHIDMCAKWDGNYYIVIIDMIVKNKYSRSVERATQSSKQGTQPSTRPSSHLTFIIGGTIDLQGYARI